MNILICSLTNSSHINNSYNKIFIWDEYFKSTSQLISIPQLIEDKSDYYKTKLLDFFFQISETKTIKNNKIIDALNYNNELSYWWLTSIGQKTNINKNSEINNVLKIIVFNDCIREDNIRSINCQIDNINIKNTFYQYCIENNISSNCENINKISFQELKDIILAIKFISKKLLHTFFKFNFYNKFNNKNGVVTFFDVFVHLKPEVFSSNTFKSSYWNDLVDFINNQEFKTNWAHIFFPHDLIPTYNDAKKLINSFTCKGDHFLIEDYITFKIYYCSLITYIKNLFLFRQVYVKILNNMKYEKFNFSYLLKKDLHDSMFGITRFTNEILIQLFDKILSVLPKQKMGFYIQENQFWEYILISKWRKYKHGKIIGVPHSTVRYWDLRYFHSLNFFNNYNKYNEILPNLILINSKYTLKLLVDSGFPIDKLKLVEALRYQHLSKPKNTIFNSKKVLIFGDYRNHINIKIVNLITDYNAIYPNRFYFYFKPHPAYNNNLKFTNISIENDVIENIWDKYSIYITSDISSTSAEVYSLGYNLMQFQDGSSLNYSPLKNINNDNLFSNYNDLESLLNKQNNSIKISNSDSFFYLDKNLNKWKKIFHEEFNS